MYPNLQHGTILSHINQFNTARYYFREIFRVETKRYVLSCMYRVPFLFTGTILIIDLVYYR